MALDRSNSSSLEQLALKGLKLSIEREVVIVWVNRTVCIRRVAVMSRQSSLNISRDNGALSINKRGRYCHLVRRLASNDHHYCQWSSMPWSKLTGLLSVWTQHGPPLTGLHRRSLSRLRTRYKNRTISETIKLSIRLGPTVTLSGP